MRSRTCYDLTSDLTPSWTRIDTPRDTVLTKSRYSSGHSQLAERPSVSLLGDRLVSSRLRSAVVPKGVDISGPPRAFMAMLSQDRHRTV